jgi:hypothetical protein
MRRHARLTVEVSISPDYVGGIVRSEEGEARDFEGWLGLAQAVSGAAADGSWDGTIAGPKLLEDNTEQPHNAAGGPAEGSG